MIPKKQAKSGKTGWQNMGGGDSSSWSDALNRLEVPDSATTKKTAWVRFRALTPPMKAPVCFVRTKSGKNMPPIYSPDWDMERQAFAPKSKDPIRLNPNLTISINEEETRPLSYSNRSYIIVIDRAAQDAGEPYIKVLDLPKTTSSEFREIIDGQADAEPEDAVHGYDLRVRKNTKQQGSAVWKIEYVEASPLTEDELKHAFGEFRVSVSGEALAKIKKKNPNIEKRLSSAGFTLSAKTGNWITSVDGLSLQGIEFLHIDSSVQVSPETQEKKRVETLKIEGVEIGLKVVSEPNAPDLELLYEGTPISEIENKLRSNGYLEDSGHQEETVTRSVKPAAKVSKPSPAVEEDEEEDDDDAPPVPVKKAAAKAQVVKKAPVALDDDEDEAASDDDDDDDLPTVSSPKSKPAGGAHSALKDRLAKARSKMGR